MRRREAAEDRARPARLDRREVARLEARRPVAHPVDAQVFAEEPAAGEPRADLTEGDAGGEQLGTRHDAVRARGKPRDLPLDGDGLVSHHDTYPSPLANS